MISVEDLGIEDGFLSGEAGLSIGLSETGNQPSKLTLQLLWVDGNRLSGTARTESTSDLPQFWLAIVYLPLQTKIVGPYTA
jgi:hypothetical protein